MIEEKEWRGLLQKMIAFYCDNGYSWEKTIENMKKSLILSTEDDFFCLGVYHERKYGLEKKNNGGTD